MGTEIESCRSDKLLPQHNSSLQKDKLPSGTFRSHQSPTSQHLLSQMPTVSPDFLLQTLQCLKPEETSRTSSPKGHYTYLQTFSESQSGREIFYFPSPRSRSSSLFNRNKKIANRLKWVDKRKGRWEKTAVKRGQPTNVFDTPLEPCQRARRTKRSSL